jgi:hypothetical protein
VNVNRSSFLSALKWITTVSAALYAGGFLADLIYNLNNTHVSGVEVDWGVTENPRFALALVLVTATAILWVWRGVGQSFAALILGGLVAYKAFSWWAITTQIKANAGLDRIPHATGWIGNKLIGASLIEVAALIATLSLLVFAIVSVVNLRQSASHQELRTLHS